MVVLVVPNGAFDGVRPSDIGALCYGTCTVLLFTRRGRTREQPNGVFGKTSRLTKPTRETVIVRSHGKVPVERAAAFTRLAAEKRVRKIPIEWFPPENRPEVSYRAAFDSISFPSTGWIPERRVALGSLK